MAETQHTVTKAELAGKLSELGLSRRHARLIVDYFFSEFAAALRRGEIIHLVGFGSFHYKIRRARHGRNPRTGQAVEVPAKQVVQFRPGSWLKGLIRRK
jgi:integration host factor subunit alpha